MNTGGRLVTGSHNRNEFILINADEIGRIKSVEEVSGEICRICGDEVEITIDGELFVACNECGFPVCRTCYEYERKERHQTCFQCKTRYKRLKGSPRVEGDEEEDDFDDLEREFDAEAIPNVGDIPSVHDGSTGNGMPTILNHHSSPSQAHEIPLLKYGEEDAQISCEKHAIIVQPRSMSPEKDTALYGYGSVAWKDRMDEWKKKQNDKLEVIKHQQNHHDNVDFDKNEMDNDLPMMDEGRQPLSRKLPIPSSKINPYRLMILLRLMILGVFFHYRILHPVPDAYGIWMTSVICEIWFATSFLLDQFTKWYPIERETYLDRLSLRYEKEGKPSELAGVDVFVTAVDPRKEPPLMTANTVLSILAVDYPVEKVSCYVSDDGAAMLTFEVLCETSGFARKWVPFCKKFNIEPRAPEWYFLQKMDYLRNKVHPAFVRERRAMKREYEEFKVGINRLVAMAEKVPDDGWRMQDGTPWPGNNVRDHPGMIQVFLGDEGVRDVEGSVLPRLVYVSREKRPGFEHHNKAGAMNALARVSGVLSNAPYILNVDCDHYINNSKAVREAMCFMMDPTLGHKVGYVQFPQRFHGLDPNDRYSNRNNVFFNIVMKCLDGLQGPVYVGTGAVFRRQALYGYDAPAKTKRPSKTCNCWPKWCSIFFCCSEKGVKFKKQQRDASKQIHALETIEEGMNIGSPISQEKLEKKFGRSQVFVSWTLVEDGGVTKEVNSMLEEAVHLISCGYEDRTGWGKEVGWMYGSITEDILTGLKMHCRGWRSIYCMPKRPAFMGSAPINLSDRLHQVLRWARGSVEILLSKHCPIWYGYGCGLQCLQRFSYINFVLYPFTCIPLLVYCTLPAVCLLTGNFISPELSNYATIVYMALFISIATTAILEMQWGGVSLDEWWRNEQFWVIRGVSSHLFALVQGLLKVVVGLDTGFMVTSKRGTEGAFSELYIFKWTSLLIPPTTLLILNVVGVVVGIANAINDGYDAWGPLMGKLVFAFWVILHLYPFFKGLIGRQERVPTVVMIWSILLASIVTLLWVRINPFVSKGGPVLEICGLDCDD